MTAELPVTVLVIDDSAHNRRTISEMLEREPDVEVLDRASDGEEGLRKAAALRPDVITLDLEMPKLDGFAFLRLLMATVPIPVIVVSSYAHKSDVFKALELGAFDFVAKPARDGAVELGALREELLEKIRAVRLIRAPVPKREAVRLRSAPSLIAAIGASTGGPPAVQRVLEAVAAEPSVCLLICQHMPEKFTQAFAERLDRIAAFTVTEAKPGDRVAPGRVFSAPGGRHKVLVSAGEHLQLQTPPGSPADKHVPSIDRLFVSVAQVLGRKALGVVLTGMGADGAQGAVAIKRAGGEVWAESEKTAVIFGMPKEAIDAGAVRRVLPLDEIGPALLGMARRKR